MSGAWLERLHLSLAKRLYKGFAAAKKHCSKAKKNKSKTKPVWTCFSICTCHCNCIMTTLIMIKMITLIKSLCAGQHWNQRFQYNTVTHITAFHFSSIMSASTSHSQARGIVRNVSAALTEVWGEKTSQSKREYTDQWGDILIRSITRMSFLFHVKNVLTLLSCSLLNFSLN